MGTYIYTLRAKRVTLEWSGRKVDANYYAFAYKVHNYFPSDRRYDARVQRYENAARNALDYYDKSRDIVVVADPKEGRKGLVGAYVYRNVRSPRWVDTGEFPGELVGFVGDDGKTISWVGGWHDYVAIVEGVRVPARSRQVMCDGRIVEEVQYRAKDGRYFTDKVVVARREQQIYTSVAKASGVREAEKGDEWKIRRKLPEDEQ